MLVVEEAIGRLHFGAAVATGGELQGGLAAHGIQHDLEAFLEPALTALDLRALVGGTIRGHHT